MLITNEMAERIRIKRAINRQTMKDLAQELGTTYKTLSLIEQGDYDVRRDIYDRVERWLDDEQEGEDEPGLP